MKKHLTSISYEEKEILYCDFTNCDKNEIISGLKSVGDEIANMGRNDLLIIFNGTNSFFDRESFAVTVEFAKALKPFRKKTALIGATGGKKFLLNSLLSITQTSAVVKPFDTLDDAKRWIIS